MYKTIVKRHVQAYGDKWTFFVSLAGEKFRGGIYSGHITAAYEAEVFKWYMRNKYGVKWHTMKAYVPDTELQVYASERGFKLTLDGVFQWLPPCIKDKLTHEGSQIAAAFAELELPLKHKELVRDAVREERDHLKRERLVLKDKLSKERAVVWLKAQQDAAKAWKEAKIELEGLPIIADQTWESCKQEILKVLEKHKQPIVDTQLQRDMEVFINTDCLEEIKSLIPAFRRTPLGGVEVTREKALEGLGDPATWDAESKALYEEFRRKPEPCPICQKFPCDSENHLHD